MICDILLLPWLYSLFFFGYVEENILCSGYVYYGGNIFLRRDVYYVKIFSLGVMCIMKKYFIEALCIL